MQALLADVSVRFALADAAVQEALANTTPRRRGSPLIRRRMRHARPGWHAARRLLKRSTPPRCSRRFNSRAFREAIATAAFREAIEAAAYRQAFNDVAVQQAFDASCAFMMAMESRAFREAISTERLPAGTQPARP